MVPATAMCVQSSPWNVFCSKAGAMAVLRSSHGAAFFECVHHREQHGPRDREHVVQNDRGGCVHQQHAEGESLDDAEQLQEEEVADVGDAHVPGAGAVHQHHPRDVAQGSDAESDDHGQQADQDDGDQFRDGNAGPARFQGEGDQAGSLAPFGGDREDAENREQQALRGGRGADEVDEGELVGVRDEQEDDDHGDGDDPDRGEQPEPGSGVDELAQLDSEQAAERDGRHARVRGGC